MQEGKETSGEQHIIEEQQCDSMLQEERNTLEEEKREQSSKGQATEQHPLSMVSNDEHRRWIPQSQIVHKLLSEHADGKWMQLLKGYNDKVELDSSRQHRWWLVAVLAA